MYTRKIRNLDSLQLLQYVLNVMGLWPPGKDSQRCGTFRRLVPLLIMFRFGYSLIFQAINVSLVWGKLDRVAEFAASLLFYLHLFAKFTSLHANRSRLQNVFDGVRTRNATLGRATAANLAVLTRVQTLSLRMIMVIPAIVAALIGAAIFMLIPLGLRERKLPRKLYLPYDASRTPVFEATLVVTTLLTFFDLLIVVLCDATFVVLSMFVGAHFHMLRIDLENITSASHKGTRAILVRPSQRRQPRDYWKARQRIAACLGPFVGRARVEYDPGGDGRERLGRDRDWDDRLAEWVKHHQEVLSILKQLQAVFKIALADQIFFNLLLGSVAMYVSTLSKSTDAAAMVVVAFLFGGVFELSLFCWCSEIISDQGDGIRIAAYNCDWMTGSTRFNRSLRLVMTQAQRAVGLRAAGVPLTRRTFRAVCKAGYYLHAVLDKIYAGEKINQRPS